MFALTQFILRLIFFRWTCCARKLFCCYGKLMTTLHISVGNCSLHRRKSAFWSSIYLSWSLKAFIRTKPQESLKEGCDLCTSLARIGIAFNWMNYAVNSIIEQKWLITILLTIFHGITIGIIKCSQFIFEWKINATRPILMSFA